jgi:hypothetical protein
VVTKGRLQHSVGSGPYALTIRAKHLIEAIRDQYSGLPLKDVNPPPAPSTGIK